MTYVATGTSGDSGSYRLNFPKFFIQLSSRKVDPVAVQVVLQVGVDDTIDAVIVIGVVVDVNGPLRNVTAKVRAVLRPRSYTEHCGIFSVIARVEVCVVR